MNRQVLETVSAAPSAGGGRIGLVLRRVVRMAAALALAIAGLLATPGFGHAQRVLIVDIDDVGYDLLDDARTPNLDQVAKEGRTLTGLWSTPLCSPTRALLQVGTYGLRSNNRIGTLVLQNAVYVLPTTGPTLPRVVTKAGLRAGKVGKWHLAQPDDTQHPLQVGWQHYTGVPHNLQVRDSYYSYVENKNGVEERVSGEYLTTRETDQAIQLVKEGFELISLSYHSVHSPHHVPPTDLFTGPTPVTDYQKTLAALEALDHELGRLLAAAKSAEYTVLIASDNGTRKAFRGGKGSLNEKGITVPCWAIGPGVQPGESSDLIGWVDFYATIAALLNVPLATGEGPDSISFEAVLAGQPGTRTMNYSERWPINGIDPNSVADPNWRRAARDERYKLIRNQGAAGDQFYDLQLDPMEKIDLLAGTLTKEQRRRLDALKTFLDQL